MLYFQYLLTYNKRYAWSTQYLNYAVFNYNSVKMTNLGHAYYDYNSVYAVTPKFFDTVEQGFLNVDMQNDSSPYSLIEQLHTPLGTGSALVGSLYKKSLVLPNLGDQFLLEADCLFFYLFFYFILFR